MLAGRFVAGGELASALSSCTARFGERLPLVGGLCGVLSTSMTTFSGFGEFMV